MLRRMSSWTPTARRFFKRRARLKASYTACQRMGAVRRRGNRQWNLSPGSVFVPCRSCKVLGRIAALHGQSSGVRLCSSGALCGILGATGPIPMQP